MRVTAPVSYLLRSEGIDVASGDRGETLEALRATLDDLGSAGS
jgi:hypothetical protein